MRHLPGEVSSLWPLHAAHPPCTHSAAERARDQAFHWRRRGVAGLAASVASAGSPCERIRPAHSRCSDLSGLDLACATRAPGATLERGRHGGRHRRWPGFSTSTGHRCSRHSLCTRNRRCQKGSHHSPPGMDECEGARAGEAYAPGQANPPRPDCRRHMGSAAPQWVPQSSVRVGSSHSLPAGTPAVRVVRGPDCTALCNLRNRPPQGHLRGLRLRVLGLHRLLAQAPGAGTATGRRRRTCGMVPTVKAGLGGRATRTASPNGIPPSVHTGKGCCWITRGRELEMAIYWLSSTVAPRLFAGSGTTAIAHSCSLQLQGARGGRPCRSQPC